MLKQIKTVQAKIELLIEDLRGLNREVVGIEAKNEACKNLEKKLNQKSFGIGVRQKKLKEDIDKFNKEKEVMQKRFDGFAVKNRVVEQKEKEIKKIQEKLEKLKIELTGRELQVAGLEEEKEKLDLEKKSFEVIQAKVEKERQITRNRKEALEERERKIKVKEDLLRKRLQG